MKGRLVRYVSVLMGVLAAFDGRACVARRKGKNKFQNNFNKVNKLKKVKVTGKPVVVKKPVVVEKPVPVIVEKPFVVEKPVVVPFRTERRACVVPAAGGGAMVRDLTLKEQLVGLGVSGVVLSELGFGMKNIVEWIDVDKAKEMAWSYWKRDEKSNKRFGEFLESVRFQTVFCYADNFFNGKFTKEFWMAFLDVATDAAVASLTNTYVLKIDDKNGKNGSNNSREYLIAIALVLLGEALFCGEVLSEGVDYSDRIIKCFFDACLATGCIGVDSKGKIYNRSGCPWSLKIMLAYCRYYGSNDGCDYAGVINKAIKNRLNGGKGGKVNVGGREIKVV